MIGADCGLLQSEPVFISSARLGELSWSLCRDERPPHLPGFSPMGFAADFLLRKDSFVPQHDLVMHWYPTGGGLSIPYPQDTWL